MKNRKSKAVIALIIEISLLVISGAIALILHLTKNQINMFIWIAIFSILMFSFVLTLSIIRYERLREIRSDFKNTNLPLYTDNTTLLCHDIKDEEQNHE